MPSNVFLQKERHCCDMQTYSALKRVVTERGGTRLKIHGGLRDQIIDMIVLEWPEGCDEDKIGAVLRARCGLRIKQKYGSVIAMFLIGVLANFIIQIVREWWKERRSHKVLMSGWSARAKETAHI